MLSTVPTPRPSKLPLPRTANKHYKQFTWAMLPVNEWFLVTWMFVGGPRKESKADICMQSFGWYGKRPLDRKWCLLSSIDQAMQHIAVISLWILTRETIYIHTYVPTCMAQRVPQPPTAGDWTCLLPFSFPFVSSFSFVDDWFIIPNHSYDEKEDSVLLLVLVT